MRQTATLAVAAGIGCLFLLCRKPKVRLSGAIWLPVIWLLIGSSRNVGEWFRFDADPTLSASERYLEGNPLDRGVLGLLLAAGIVVLLSRRRRLMPVLRGNRALLLYFAFCAVSILWSEYPFVAFKRWNRIIGDLTMVLIVLTERNWVEALKRMLTRTSFLLIPVSLLFVKYYPEMGRSFSRYEGRILFTGVSTDKNGLGMICLIFGLGSAWCLLSAYEKLQQPYRRWQMIAYSIIVATAVWLAVLSDSATALACLVIASAVMIATSAFAIRRSKSIVHLLVLFVISIPIYALFLDPHGGLVASVGRDPTLTGRTMVWDVALRFVDNPVVGAGFESYWLGARLYKILEIVPGLNQAHNGYLEIYLNLGWIGILLLAVLLVTGYVRIVESVRLEPDIGRLRLAYYVAAIIYNLTEAGFKMMSPVWIMFLVVSAASAAPRRSMRISASQKSPTQYLRAPRHSACTTRLA